MTAMASSSRANDNWQDDPNSLDVENIGLAPKKAAESATVLHLPAGAYTAITSGVNDGHGSRLGRGV